VKVSNVNTTDIESAIKLGCRTMSNVFNADDNDIPFFSSEVIPNPRLSFSSVHSESHVPGRHLNALLNAEDAAGVSISEEAVEKHATAAFFSYSGPVPLPMNRDRVDGPIENFNDHNVREGMHALYALVKYRNSDRAREVAESSIEFILDAWDPVNGWDREGIAKAHGIRWTRQTTFITGVGRAIGPLVKYFRATGSGKALQLASVLAEKATSEFFLPDGSYDREKFGSHTHSTTCVMSSLAQLADLTGDAALLERVRAFADNGLWEIRDELGWVIESSADDSPPDKGEGNNTGDTVETDLILGRHGYPGYFQDAERILRGHLLPSQLRDVGFIPEPANSADEDGLRSVRERHLGAFGFPAPYGHHPLGLERISFNMDIVGGVVGTLCEVLREGVVKGPDGIRVNLLLAQDTPDARVQAGDSPGRVSVTTKHAAPLWIRLPRWADRTALQVSGTNDYRVLGEFLFTAQSDPGKPIFLDYPVARTEITLAHRTRNIRTILEGDAVAAMDNLGADLTYFDPLH
jgi:hypothetical protein